MDFPLIGICDGDIDIFATLEEARAAIEPPDVDGGIWSVYDRNGQRLTVRVIRPPMSVWWPPSWFTDERVELSETGVIDRENVEIAIRRYLEAFPNEKLSMPKQLLNTTSFDNLVDQAVDLKEKRIL